MYIPMVLLLLSVKKTNKSLKEQRIFSVNIIRKNGNFVSLHI